jgi:hypothetical protein
MAKLKNIDVREALKSRNIKWWEVCDYLGISQCTLSRQLRYELPDDYKAKIISAVEAISANEEE